MVSIKVKNIKKIQDAFVKYGDEAIKEISNIVELTANTIEDEAKVKAPVDNGTLRQSISKAANIQHRGLTWSVHANMPYSAYMEFGTGGLVDIPIGWESMASKFKGKGIRQVNIMPHPFMYPASLVGKRFLNREIRKSIKFLNKKYNG